jgi:glycosyltransferase involved in cell wall biosynthesis
MATEITYSITVPVYNSEGSLKELCDRIIAALQSYTFEIILVDDASTDYSWQVIMTIKKEYPAIIKAIRLSENYGQHKALICAFSHCRGAYIVTIDDDLQFDPQDILKLIQKQQESSAEVVYGIFKNNEHSYIRRLGSNSIKQYSKHKDNNNWNGSHFRLISKDIITTIISEYRNVFIFIDEVLHWITVSFATVEVQHYPRKVGKSSYTFGKLVKLYLNLLTDYSAIPLKVMIYSGFVFSIISFLVGLYFLYRKLMYAVPLGYTSVIVAITFCSGIIVLFLGVIGQYLYKIYASQQNKPLYNIKQIL